MSEKYTVVHKKSRVVTEGQPKLPSASTIEYGEIAINYAEGYETLSIKNSNNEIATFSSDNVVNSALTEIQDSIDEIQSALTEDELVISTSLSDLNDRVEDLESVSIPHNTSDLNNDSGFITSADTAHTHTAAEVGAMATSERSNYLPTGTTLDNVADGSTRKLSDYSTTAHTHTAAEVGAMATSERGNYLTTATTIPNVDNYFDDVEYDSNTKRINFKHGATVRDYIDATDFIKDGMVDSVAISTPTGGTNSGVTCLVVTFNTDAGKDDIEIPLSSIFNPSNYYNKTETDTNFLSKSAYTEDEEVIASALNDLNSRIEHMYVPEYVSELINDNAYVSSAETEERYSLTSHTHSQYATTAHTHTAAEVGAMATSERSNYLPTGTTLDNVADGTTRKLSNYSTTGHSHTAAEVGAMATSERSNYSTTGHTHTAAEVGAMATSERSNYLTTATTIPTEATIAGSGFTKSGITEVDVNGSAITISDGAVNIDMPVEVFDVTLTYGIAALMENQYTITTEMYNSMLAAVEDGRLPVLRFVADTGDIIFAYFTLRSVTYGNGLLFHGSDPWKLAATYNGALDFMAILIYSDGDSIGHDTTQLSAMNAANENNYSLTSHTHSQYATTAETANFITSAYTGFSSTGHTHSQYATTAHTHDYLPLSGGDVTGDIFLIENGNEWVHTQLTEHSITFNSGSTSSAKSASIYPYWYEGQVFGGDVTLYLPNKDGTLAVASDIPTETDLTSSGFTKNGLTSADTANVFLAISGTTTYDEITAARNSGKVLLAKDETHTIYTYESQTYGVGHVFSCVQTTSSGDILVSRLVCNQSNQWTETTYYVPNESDIASSGFTKNGITGINVNGTAATITNGVAEINVQGGGGSTLPSVTAADNGKVLMVVNGAWAVVMPTTVYTGTDTPLSSIGNDGDIYLQTS